jgi:hypothetical protein
MSAGIDYGMGRINRDPENGIRFGVISQGSVGQTWYDEAEADYGRATCPSCGNECVAFEAEKHETLGQYNDRRKYACTDYVCEHCLHTLDSDECYGDEPLGWNYSGDGYELVDCLDSDIMVLKSPFYTRGNYCSPCVPGAVSLESDNEEGAKAYCLGHDWFEEGKAPYRVFSVATNEEVLP